MFRFIDPFYFFLSLGVGFLIVYLITPPPQVVVKFPSPYNAGKVTYGDKTQGCFVFDAKSTECPLDKSLIKPQPFIL